MSRTRSIITSIALCAALGTTLAGCTSTAEDNTAAACDAYDSFVASVAEARSSLTTASTVGEIADARDSVKDAYAKLDDALGSVSADRKAALEDAWSAYNDAVSDVDPSLTVPEAAKTLTEEVGAIETAQADLSTDLTCP